MAEVIKTVAETRIPLSQLSNEERRRKYDEYRKKQGKSKIEVKGNPNFHYFWAPKEDDGELVRLDYLGYSIMREPNVKDILAGKPAQREVTAAGLREDGTYVIADVILMKCPLEVYELHLLDVEIRSEAQISGAVEEFKMEAEKKGIPTFEVAGSRKG